MISRRRTLCVMSVGPLMLLGIPTLTVSAQQKVPKDSVEYQEQPKDDEKCSECRFFVGPDGCEVVEGTISPDAWCNLFQPKA
jgi:hypothetical protein